ncbi:MAG TPA: PAS domain S-box protein, partial [Magnetospirillaceae bacterium]|nr:PAS domain S-box protein [Magnetospirillaceae bacterium]
EKVQLQLSEAIGNLADAIALFDSEDRLVICNAAYAEAFGFGGSPPAPGIAFADIVRTAAAAGRDTDPAMEERHRAATGEAAVVQTADGGWMQIRECRTKDGGTLTIRSDITGIKRKEEDLRNLQHHTALILEAAGDGIIDLDCDGRIGLANRAACAILGYAGSSLTGLSVSRLFVDGEDVDSTATSVDTSFLRADGTLAQVQYQATPIIEDGRPAGAVLVFRDVALQRKYEAELADHQRDLAIQVTERTAELQRENAVRARTEAALRASRERLRSITDSLFHCVLVFNYAGHVVFANLAARRMLKVEDQEVEGLPMDYLFQLVSGGEAVPFDGSPLREAVHGTVMHDNDACLRTADGKEMPIAYVCTSLMEEGHRRSAVMSFRDITDIKQAQWEVMQASRLASVGQLASGIAHEINTPIQYIGNNLGFIGDSARELLAQLTHLSEASGSPVNDQAAFLAQELPLAIAESIEGVEQIGRIVLSMKEFSHPGSANKSMTDINRALETTLTVTTNVWKLVAQVERRFDPDLPPVPCHAGEMNQVFLNLIVNAVHAIEASGKPQPGKIILTTARREGHVDISVEDSGTGVPAAIREKIFDPFYTTKEVGKGTGQGLAICLDVVVHKHGGKIAVGGVEGEGALFVISLPIEDTASERSA